MKICGMMPVRNEQHELGLTSRAALRWVDSLVILLHACTDRSAAIARDVAREHDGRVWVFEKDGDWTEMQHRQAMLELARCADGPSATHLAIVDADEIATGNMLDIRAGNSLIRGMCQQLPRGHVLQLPLYNLRGGLSHFHANGIWGQRWLSVAFVDDARLGWSGDTFHSREPQGPAPLRNWRPIAQGAGGVMHLWGADERRLVAKHSLYKLTHRGKETRAEIERMYNWAIKGEPGHPSFGTPETWRYSPAPSSWWEPYEGLMQYLQLDSEPWQIEEVRRIVAEHGRDRFAGLDLFGVDCLDSTAMNLESGRAKAR